MKSILVIFIIILLPCLCLAQGDADCITAKCHADIGTKEFVHGPVGAKICTICHIPNPDKKHQFEFTVDKEELCFSCHEESRDMMLENSLHTPVSDGDCTGCHDPHQENHKYMLKGATKDLCFTCHKAELFTDNFVHGPVGAGDCNACHNPHASANENQLVTPADKICFNCHKEQEQLMNKRHKHSPVEENCTNCHNPHANKAKFLLISDSPDLCFTCHDHIKEHLASTHPHNPVNEGTCSTCHDAHASDFPKLFPKKQQDLCLSCHDALKEYVDNQSHKHGPVKDGDCNACHDPHGSEFTGILRNYFPAEFYNSYETENYAICFQCHSKDVALDEETSTLTEFRDGNQNLHYLHVNKEVKGRSCKACHQVHASTQDKHIRTSVPFGKIKWELPVTFTKLENGGSCVVGCHAPKEYHRD